MDDPKPRNLTSGLAQNEPEQDRGAFYQRLNYEKLASDRIGEELNPNASIWKLYAEEAKEYDIEFTRERNENLNNMLLFATLFSAIVTTFIIESTNLLEQDSSDVSTQLLLMLVQSQRRIETGITNYTATPVEIPEFVPSPTARLINVLWFASLMISLGAAVVAILAKEWLTAFTTNRTRDAHKYALERQARHISLEIWNMLLIIDLLPTFLNFSLFVFCLGLIIRLWLLDFVVAGVTTVISAVVCGIYLFFVISGAVYETCPYKARLSAYVREIVQGLHKRFTASESSPQINRNNIKPDSQKTIKSEEMDLLNWLFSSSSDPFLGTYVTQALAGLRSLSLDLPTFLSKENSIQALCSTYTQNSKTLTSVFELGYQALTQLQMAPIQGRNELESCEGSNAARLAIAIAEIYPYALTWQLCLPEKAFQVRENRLPEAERNTPKIASSNGTTKPGTNDNTLAIKMPSITDDVFHALDLVWVETSPALGLSVYANLLTAELKMVRYALAFLSPQEETRGTNSSNVSTERAAPPNGQDRLLPRYSRLRAMTQSALIVTARLLKVLRGARLPGPSEEEPPISPGHTSIEMATSSDIRSRLLGLGQDGLRERYGLALTRAALIIKASLSHLTSKGSQELQSAITALLSQATELVEQEKPGSDGTYRFGTDDYWDLRDISITIASKSDTVQVVTCRREALAYELMEGLIRLCEGGSGDAPLLEGFRVAAFNLLVTFWPAHIQQRKLDRSVESSVLTWAVQQWETIPTQATRCDSQISAEIIVYQSTVLAHIAG